jgi:hypothetical protein
MDRTVEKPQCPICKSDVDARYYARTAYANDTGKYERFFGFIRDVWKHTFNREHAENGYVSYPLDHVDDGRFDATRAEREQWSLRFALRHEYWKRVWPVVRNMQ